MFEQLQEIVTIHVEYTTDGNLSINSGKGDGIRDNLVIREGGPNSNPVISGSSLKGVIRSTIESLLTAGGHEICIPDTCVPEVEGGDGSPTDRKNAYLNKHKLVNRKCLSSECKGCQACSMFGRAGAKNIPSLAGCVMFQDARSKDGKSIKPISRSHVAIARDTRSQASGALMTIETVPAEETFAGDIILHNPEPWMVGGVLFVLEKLLGKSGIGAKKTAGYGHLSVQVIDVSSERFGQAARGAMPQNEQYRNDCLNAWLALVPHAISQSNANAATESA